MKTQSRSQSEECPGVKWKRTQNDPRASDPGSVSRGGLHHPKDELAGLEGTLRCSQAIDPILANQDGQSHDDPGSAHCE